MRRHLDMRATRAAVHGAEFAPTTSLSREPLGRPMESVDLYLPISWARRAPSS
jgi:hypothetical protein